jgi:phage baseplate assembly protein W
VAETREFLGRGWSFPPAFSNGGRSLEMVEAEKDIDQSLHILLSTHLGERVMRPTFGWKREALLFEPLSTSFATFLKREIETAILFFEPRIELGKVTFETAADVRGQVELRIDYTIRATNSRANLVYPLYLDEGSSP